MFSKVVSIIALLLLLSATQSQAQALYPNTTLDLVRSLNPDFYAFISNRSDVINVFSTQVVYLLLPSVEAWNNASQSLANLTEPEIQDIINYHIIPEPNATSSYSPPSNPNVTVSVLGLDSEYLFFTVTAPTNGWVAFGQPNPADPNSNTILVSDLVIGWVDDNTGEASIGDYRVGTNPTATTCAEGGICSDSDPIKNGACVNLVTGAVSSTNGTTTISFARRFSTGDQVCDFDIAAANQTQRFVVAYGNNDTLAFPDPSNTFTFNLTVPNPPNLSARLGNNVYLQPYLASESSAIRVNNYSNVFYFNGVASIAQDINQLSSSLVLVIDGVLLPVSFNVSLYQVLSEQNATEFRDVLLQFPVEFPWLNGTDSASNETFYTVFAPTNAALDAFGEIIDLSFILGHVLNGTFYNGGLNGSIVSLNPNQTLSFSRIGQSLTVNGVPVSVSDLSFSNGVVHFIDAVLALPNTTQTPQPAGVPQPAQVPQPQVPVPSPVPQPESPQPAPQPETPQPSPVPVPAPQPESPQPAPVPTPQPSPVPAPESPQPSPSPVPAPQPESPQPSPQPESPQPAPAPESAGTLGALLGSPVFFFPTDLVLSGFDANGLLAVLEDPSQNLTLLVPNNNVIQTFADLIANQTASGEINRTLANHIIPQRYQSSQLQNDQILLPLAQDSWIRVNLYPNTYSPSGVFFNGRATVLQADVSATNGVGHVVNDLVLPTTTSENQTIYQFLVADGRFTTLVRLLESQNLAQTLNNPVFGVDNSFTLFAPDDDAFQQLGFDLDNTQLSNILLSHVLRSTYYTVGLTTGAYQTLTVRTVNIVNSLSSPQPQEQPQPVPQPQEQPQPQGQPQPVPQPQEQPAPQPQLAPNSRRRALQQQQQSSQITVNGVPLLDVDHSLRNGVVHVIGSVLFVESQPQPSPQPVPEPQPVPSPQPEQPSPEPQPVPSPQPSPQPEEQPQPSTQPQPEPEPAPQPSAVSADCYAINSCTQCVSHPNCTYCSIPPDSKSGSVWKGRCVPLPLTPNGGNVNTCRNLGGTFVNSSAQCPLPPCSRYSSCGQCVADAGCFYCSWGVTRGGCYADTATYQNLCSQSGRVHTDTCPAVSAPVGTYKP